MLVREVYSQEKNDFDQLVDHPLQSWAWGNARSDTGVKVLRLGLFDGKRMTRAWLLTVHKIPYFNKSIFYCPRGVLPDEIFTNAIVGEAVKYDCILIKVEPNLWTYVDSNSKKKLFSEEKSQLLSLGFIKGKPLFTKYNFVLDLMLSEQELLAGMKSKTRYNVRLAKKKGVIVDEDNSNEAFEKFLDLMAETTNRQKFFAHDAEYHRKVWRNMRNAGIAHLLVAKYNNEIVTAWELFKWKDVLYYPYGASSRKYRKVMANNMMMWEAIRFGKSHGCKKFDLWGTAGLNPSQEDPWYGFHKFKQGFGPELVESIGTYDMIVSPLFYKFYSMANKLRGHWLKLLSSIKTNRF